MTDPTTTEATEALERKHMVLMVLTLAEGKPVSRGRLGVSVLLLQNALLRRGVKLLPEPYPFTQEDFDDLVELLVQESDEEGRAALNAMRHVEGASAAEAEAEAEGE